MSQENVEIVRQALDAVNQRDTEAGLPPIDPEVELQSAIIGGAEGNRGLESGVEIDSANAWLFTLRRGRIVRARGYLNPQEALEGAGVAK
jgi:hypothetical protein